MKNLKQSLGMTALAAILSMTASCASYPDNPSEKYSSYTEPPHSAKHGYRQQHNGHEISYDENLGVYQVIGMPDYYYLDNQYYRYDGNRWYNSKDVSKGWRDFDESKLPPGLAKKARSQK